MWREARVTRLSIRAPSVFRCGLLILTIKLALNTMGFGRTVKWTQRRVHAVPERPGVTMDLILSIEHAVAVAGALYPGRALCLEQSLALYYLLRRRGVGVEFRMGVQPHPFLAHAWVEYRGEVINDVSEHAKRFVPLPGVLL